MSKIVIKVQRDSVCAGDDINAPHEKIFKVEENWKVVDLLNYILSENYLVKIQGQDATWSVAGPHPIAVISKQWDKPRMIISSDATFEGDFFNLPIRYFKFSYHLTLDPNVVYKVLKRYKPNIAR